MIAQMASQSSIHLDTGWAIIPRQHRCTREDLVFAPHLLTFHKCMFGVMALVDLL